MSGFEFHLVCRNCGITSQTYTFRYDSVTAPQYLLLPVVNRVTKAFEEWTAKLAHGELSDAQIHDIVTRQSSAELTVHFPAIGGDGIVLKPQAQCPRCGVPEISCVLGSTRPFALPVSSVTEVIQATRASVEGVHIVFDMHSARVTVKYAMERGEDGIPIGRWSVEQTEASTDVDVRLVVADIIEQLARRGSFCSTPRHMRAFSRFDELIR